MMKNVHVDDVAEAARLVISLGELRANLLNGHPVSPEQILALEAAQRVLSVLNA